MSIHPKCNGCINGEGCLVRDCGKCGRRFHILTREELPEPYYCFDCED